MAAVMRVLESWLYFQKGNAVRALQILHEAEAALSRTDDHLTLGNVQLSYGRIARRQGRYQHAIKYFTAAIHHYRQRDPRHRNIARSLNNLANVKRLIALQLLRKIDADAARRRKAASKGRASENGGNAQHRDRFEQLREEAVPLHAQTTTFSRSSQSHAIPCLLVFLD